MKIICIKEYTKQYNELSIITINKVYDTVGDDIEHTLSPTHYRMIDDWGEIGFYSKTYFITLNEFRNNIIDKIL